MMRKNLLFTLFSICLLAFGHSAAYAQNQVSGVVKDTKNEPLIGVTILVKHTNKATLSDINGTFTINCMPNDTINFAYAGMESVDVAVNGRSTLDVTMSENATQIDQVVVIGYGTARKRDLTTAISVVSTSDIDERPIVNSAEALQGKASGVSVVRPNGQPGSGMVVRVRGSSSITASNDPLYVVDGVPVSNIDFLSPNDIASMQVLKDASSAAIYGSRAANGVVLITTKSGYSGKAQINFSGYVGFQEVSKRMNSLNTAQYSELMGELGAINLPDGLTDQTDWFDETFRTALTQNYQLSISAGNDRMKYYISAGLTDELGVVRGPFYRRFNFRTNVEGKVTNWFKVNANISYSDSESSGIITGTGSNRAGVILSVINTPTYAPIWDSNNPGQYYNNFYGANITHPVENLSRTESNRDKYDRLIGSLSGEITFLPELKLKSTFALDRENGNMTTFLDPVKTAYGRSQYGNSSDQRQQSTVLTWDNILTFDKTMGKHSFGAMAGTSWTYSNWSGAYQQTSHYIDGTIQTGGAGNKVEQNAWTSRTEWAIMSFFARANYNYDSKYLVTANFRADGSSKFAPSGRWGYFPSVSAAWRISGEEFMENATWLNDLKLRAGVGQTGNQSGVSEYGWMQLYNYNRQDWTQPGKENALPTISQANMRNSDLTWETTTQYNIGIDASFFNSRLNISLDAYYKYTTNLLMNVPLPSTASASSILRNEGEMSNRGIEFMINSRNIEAGDFTWTSDLSMSFNRNKLEKLTLQQIYSTCSTSEAISENLVRMTPGQPLGMFWGYISEGVDSETGMIKYRDINGDGKINESDKTYIGNPNPDFTFGFNNTFSWKGLSLNLFFTGSVGNDIYNASRIETEGMYNGNNQSTAVLRRWKTPGQITDMPKASRTTENLVNSTRFVEDGSFFRLKSLTLSYNITSPALKRAGITRLQPYFTADNLFTVTNYSGFDPEVNQWGGNAMVLGVDWGTYPQTRSYIVGINITF